MLKQLIIQMVCFFRERRDFNQIFLGYLCLMYNEDGTAHVGSSSSCQSLHSPSSLFVSTYSSLSLLHFFSYSPIEFFFFVFSKLMKI